jgi:DNA-binding NarL/FixJ family response regulator
MPGILIVDDNMDIRYLLRTFVESKTTFKVCREAQNGVEAIEKARQLQPDLVLLDLSMPLMNGAETASILKQMMPHLRIILFTVHGDTIGASLVTAIGVDLVLSKEDGIGKLDEHIKALMPVALDDSSHQKHANPKPPHDKPV